MGPGNLPPNDGGIRRRRGPQPMRGVRFLTATPAPTTMTTPVRIRGRDLRPHKATVNPTLGARTVLTNSPWDFVSLWLKRERKERALFFWNQARSFADAALGMPVQSAPLLHYYAFMNATKALLSAKGVSFDEMHGVKSHNMRGTSRKITLSNAGIRLLARGVAPSLSQYLGEAETCTTHSLKELLFNIPCIHRTYCLTYKNQADLFIPLIDCRYIYESASGQAYFAADLSQDFANLKYIKRLPSTLMEGTPQEKNRAIRSASSVPIGSATVTSPADLAALGKLHRSLRPDINYIGGSQTLWYAKINVAGPKRLKRSPLTLTLVAMHRLSEMCRYRPMELGAFLAGQKNWLLSEFIQMSAPQFIDEIAAELTGYQFMAPNVRPPT